MKNHRFLWLRNRTTNNRKCEKARNIKEKRTIEMFKSGKYSVRIASCKATLEVEITLGSFIRSGRCICQRMQATRYARVLPVPTPASHREISLLYKVSKTSWQSAICSSRTAMLCRGKISRKIFSAIRWDSV